MTKTYLGDAVYAQRHPSGDVVLTTEDGIACSNVIVLEPQVLAALVAWDKADRTRSAQWRRCVRRPRHAQGGSHVSPRRRNEQGR